jgi:twitching motility protein PilT
MTIDELLALAVNRGASDIHLKVGIMPIIRKHGVLRPLTEDSTPITISGIEGYARAILDDEKWGELHKKKQMDLGFGIRGLGRFRANIFLQRGTIRMVIRSIPDKITPLDQLGLPATVGKLADYERGLVLVTGVTGSGKSTTLAGLIDRINRTKNRHILTIEDPIEFLIADRKSIITQREVGVDTPSFSEALIAAMRQDPDVILIGEMRDAETIHTALTAAETGHMVFSTLHTADAQETINRIISSYEPHQQHNIRVQLASVLRGVVAQRLAKKKDGSGFVPVAEVLVNNSRIREMIEDPSKTKKINQAIEEGRSAWGMQSFDQSLVDLVKRGLIDQSEALRLSTSPQNLTLRLQGVSGMADGTTERQEAQEARDSTNTLWKGIPDLEVDENPTTTIYKGRGKKSS